MNFMENDLVSVITPSYNSSLYIETTIQAVLAQTYSNWELLITDDCSTDDTVAIIERYVQQDSRIKLFRLEKNGGGGIARNNSIHMATGRYIAFCDSDDRWLPEKLEKQITFMREKGVVFSYTSYYECSEEGVIKNLVGCRHVMHYWDFLRDSVGCLSVVYDANVLGKVYMPTIRKRQDWALWLLLIKKCKHAYGLKQPLAIYRLRKDSISAQKLKLVRYNLAVYKEVLHFSPLKAWLVFGFLFLPTYAFKRLRKFFNKETIDV